MQKYAGMRIVVTAIYFNKEISQTMLADKNHVAIITAPVFCIAEIMLSISAIYNHC